MRTFHTHTNCEATSLFGSDQIGRSSGQLVPSQIKKKSSPASNSEKQSAYSMRSKLETMKDNLRDGAIYVRKQAENLRSIDHTVSLLRNEYLKVMNSSTNQNPSQRPEILLHHQALNSLTSDTFYGHPLFGYGFENPIRIHLKLGSQSKVHSIPIVPLLSSHPLQALLASSKSTQAPGQDLFQSLQVDVLNALLGAKDQEDTLELLEVELLRHGNARNRLRTHPDAEGISKPGSSIGFLRRLIMTLSLKNSRLS